MQIERITIAINDMAAMVGFYNAVFNANLHPFGAAGDTQFHRGKLDGMTLVFCPNEIAEVDARQNRQQFHFRVDDLDAVLQRALDSGGKMLRPVGQACGMKSGSVVDPDGNTMEFIEYEEGWSK